MIETKSVFGRQVKVYSERPQTIVDMLDVTVSKYPQKEALIDGDIRLSYRELKEKVNVVAANLQKRFQIKKGDRVALLLQNCIEFVELVFACAKIGAIIVPLNTRLQEKELGFMLNHSGTKLLVTDSESESKITAMQQSHNIKGIKDVILIGKEEKQLREHWHSYCILEKVSQTVEYENMNEEDPLFIMYTSGTTGTPKGAIGSHIGVIHSAMNYEKVLKTNHDMKTLIAVPLFHVTGLIGQLLHAIRVGGTSVIMKRYQTEPYIQTVVKEKVSFLFNVPTIYIMMMSHSLFSKYAYPFVKTIAYGGAPMSNETIYQLRKKFPNAALHNAYGATETSSPTTIMPMDFPDSKIDSVGLPVPVADVKVVNDEMVECQQNEVGELLIKGPMVVEGYWDNEQANKSSFIDGYWLSGDMAKIDDDGYVYIMDRKKEMINRGGEKVFSIEVENALYNHPAVLEVAVVGVPDEVFGEQVKAFVVRKEGYNATARELKESLNKQLADYKIPSELVFIDELPRNPGGKVLKSKLINKYKNNKSSDRIN